MEGFGNLEVGLLLLVLAAADVANGCAITIRNNCPYAVTACAQAYGGPSNRYAIAASGAQKLDFGPACFWQSGIIFPSVGGQCSDRNVANAAQFTLGGLPISDYYYLSNINAYTIGMEIRPTVIAGGETPMGMRCGSPRCVIYDIRDFCQPTNFLLVYPAGAMSCINRDGRAGVEGSAGTQQFHDACPLAYSYQNDTSAMFSCSKGTEYDVIFCPLRPTTMSS